MSENRKLKRRHLIYYLQVVDADTNNPLGFLADITEEGLMLVSEKRLPAGQKIKLKMKLPDNRFDERFLLFTAETVWCRQDVNEELYDIGFKIFDLPLEKRLLIEDMVKAIGFLD